jgi:hypothetical protein
VKGRQIVSNGDGTESAFKVDTDTWMATLTAVKGEGKSNYEEWAPAFLAAIELGFMDEYLQELARHMRKRHEHLVDPSKPGPAYIPVDVEAPEFDDNAQVFGKNGLKLKPARYSIGDDDLRRSEFRALGNAYLKADFIDRYVQIDFPSRGIGRGNIWQVVRTLRGQAFEAVLVYMANTANTTASHKLGMTQRFKFEYHTHLFEH